MVERKAKMIRLDYYPSGNPLNLNSRIKVCAVPHNIEFSVVHDILQLEYSISITQRLLKKKCRIFPAGGLGVSPSFRSPPRLGDIGG